MFQLIENTVTVTHSNCFFLICTVQSSLLLNGSVRMKLSCWLNRNLPVFKSWGFGVFFWKSHNGLLCSQGTLSLSSDNSNTAPGRRAGEGEDNGLDGLVKDTAWSGPIVRVLTVIIL